MLPYKVFESSQPAHSLPYLTHIGCGGSSPIFMSSDSSMSPSPSTTFPTSPISTASPCDAAAADFDCSAVSAAAANAAIFISDRG